MIKPINLTRSIDLSVTNSFDMAIRLPESGSKIACKYVSTPVLLRMPAGEVKFDMRYVLLLRSLRPLKLYVHKTFWIRVANRPFSLQTLDDCDTHFTVINFRAGEQLQQLDCETFVGMFNEQHETNWSAIEQRIFQMFRELFHCATAQDPPLGVASCASSRAVYAADLILERSGDNQMQPKLLEMNSAPDCHRPCSHCPQFFNQIFNVLFRDFVDGQDVVDISMS